MAETIHVEYPTLPLALVHKVVPFYLDNKAEVDAYLAEVDARIERQRAEYRPSPGILRLRELKEARCKSSG